MLLENTETSPHSVLYPDIVEFSKHREVLLVAYFNTRICSQQTSLLDFHSNPVLLPEMDMEDSGFPQFSANSQALIIGYG